MIADPAVSDGGFLGRLCPPSSGGEGDYALLDYFVLAILLFFAFGGSAFASSQLTPISRHKGASESGYYNCGDSSNENAIFIKEGAFASGEEPSVWTEAPWHYWMRFFSFIGFAIIGVIGFALLKRR